MKKKNTPVSKVSDKIPFLSFAGDLLKVNKNLYTACYRIENVVVQDPQIYRFRLSKVLAAIPQDCICQFMVHNEIIEREDYLRTIVVPNTSPEADIYNRTVIDISDVGHNNTKKTVYVVIGKNAADQKDAEKWFSDNLPAIETAFADIKIKRLPALDYLEVFFKIYKQKQDDMRNLLDLKNDGNPTLNNLKHLKMTEKDMVAPKTWNVKSNLIDYSILDEGTENECYARAMFLSSVPVTLSENLVRDLSGISSNMILSVICTPCDPQAGYDSLAEKVKKNTVISKQAKRDSIEDKKNKAQITIRKRKETTEQAYFEESALNVVKETVAASEQMMAVSVVMVLFADDLAALDRYTDMLKSSASKFACAVKPLDLTQKEGFDSALPLCNCKVDVTRFLTTKRLVSICPVNAAVKIKRGGAYQGINTINDNLIIHNRKDGGNIAGLICGAEKSGKTYELKRDILNALLTTKADKVSVIVSDDSLDSFMESLNGCIAKIPVVNPFYMTDKYGLTEEDKEIKKLFLTAFATDETEAEAFLNEDMDFNDMESVLRVLEQSEKYAKIKDALMQISDELTGAADPEKRLYLYKVQTAEDYLTVLDYLWNQSIEDRKQDSVSDWIYVDKIDTLLTRDTALQYLLKIQALTDALGTPVTYVVQDSIRLITDQDISYGYALEEVVKNCGYIKILNLTPKEREKYAEWLNIPASLMQYISNVAAGEGLLITPVSNIAFTDNYLGKDNEFTKIFLR